MGQWQIESLQPSHDRTAFDCGKESLNQWLKQRAGQWERKELVRCYVAVPTAQSRGWRFGTREKPSRRCRSGLPCLTRVRKPSA